jgi:hypothetical protein
VDFVRSLALCEAGVCHAQAGAHGRQHFGHSKPGTVPNGHTLGRRESDAAALNAAIAAHPGLPPQLELVKPASVPVFLWHNLSVDQKRWLSRAEAILTDPGANPVSFGMNADYHCVHASVHRLRTPCDAAAVDCPSRRAGMLDATQRSHLCLEVLSRVREAKPAAFCQRDAAASADAYRAHAGRARAALVAIQSANHSQEVIAGERFGAALVGVERSRLTFVPFLSRVQPCRVCESLPRSHAAMTYRLQQDF